jgi:RNA methyltransferase, TrmH family
MNANLPELITSFKNPKIQYIRELLISRKFREDNHACVLEGVRLAEEALQAGFIPQIAVFSDGLSSRGMELVDSLQGKPTQILKVPDELMSKISATENGQGLLLIVEPRTPAFPSTLDFVLILDGIKDPGNMGTILRTAAAAQTQLVIVTPGCVDVFSPKVLRAGMGAHFYLPVISMTWLEIIQKWSEQKDSTGLYLAESSLGKPIWSIDLTKPTWIIIGGEAEGAGAEARNTATEMAMIPMPGKSESLNAAIAAGIILFEVVRQRGK